MELKLKIMTQKRKKSRKLLRLEFGEKAKRWRRRISPVNSGHMAHKRRKNAILIIKTN